MADNRQPAAGEGQGAEGVGPEVGLSPEDLETLRRHMEQEEFHADDARLSSAESFQLWIMSHPALRQMHIVDQFNQIGPAILEVLKRLLGL